MWKQMHKSFSGLAVLALGVVGVGAAAPSGDASAAAFTLSAPIVINAGNNGGSGVFGTISPVTSLTGTSVCLGGTCLSSATQDWLLFTMTLSAGSAVVDQIGVGVAAVATVAGVGHFTDPSETPTGGGVSGSVGTINYDFLSTSLLNLQPGETTDRLFGAFALGALPGPGIFPVVPPGTTSFMISSGADFSVSTTMVLVPEPTTALLLAAGLAGLALAGRRRA